MASNRVTIKGILSGEYSFERPSFGYGMETVHIYKISAEDGTVYVWKTTSAMAMEIPYQGKIGCHNFEDRKGNPIDYLLPRKGDTVTITASIKGESEYKGEMQTEIQRVKVTEIIWKEEVKVESKEQDLTLADGDEIRRMPYKQYKEHYSDCETVKGSFFRDEHTGDSFIKVIIRNGRMKASGVRGEHFSGYEIEWFENGEKCVCSFRAVNEDNALKQARKAFPNGTDFNCRKVYFHRGYHKVV